QQGGPFLRRCLTDRAGSGVLFRTQGFEFPQRGSPPLIGGEEGIHQSRILTAGSLARAGGVRVFTKGLKIDHPNEATLLVPLRCIEPPRGPVPRPVGARTVTLPACGGNSCSVLRHSFLPSSPSSSG